MRKTFFIAVVLSLASTSMGFAQKLPAMYVPKKESDARLTAFSYAPTSKYKRLQRVLPALDLNFTYQKAAIEELLSKVTSQYEGLRVYFAVYDSCDGFSLPGTDRNKKLILLFSPGYKERKRVPEDFYYIAKKDSIDSVYQIPLKDTICVNEWIENFAGTNIQDILRLTLIPNDPDNEYPRGSGQYYDTRSIFYDTSKLREAITTEDAIPHILPNGTPADIVSYRFSFAAISNKGTLPDGQGHRWRNRLVLDIDYMYKDTRTGTLKPMYFENLRDYASRLAQTPNPPTNLLGKTPTKLSAKKNGGPHMKSIDNGQLCPTYCPVPEP